NMPLFECSAEQIQALTRAVNSSTVQKCSFIETFMLPTLEVHPEKISCNPLNLMEFFPGAWGFTGTLWNFASMHRKLSPKPTAGTNAKTVTLLWNHSYDAVKTIPNNKMKTLIAQLGKEKYEMIADAGAYFNEMSNEEIAKELSKASGKPCIFYNVKQEQAIWIEGKVHLLSEVRVTLDQCITFLDQSHCTGSDVPQKSDAVAFVTIGPNMLMRDLLQAVWRLRGLAAGQRVKFVLTEDVSRHIRELLNLKEEQEITFKEILLFTIHNQSKRQGKDNFKALSAELAAFTQSLLFICQTSAELSAEEKKAAMNEMRSLWIKRAIIPPRDLYGKVSTLEDAQQVAEEEGLKTKRQLHLLLQKLPFLARLGLSEAAVDAAIDEIVTQKAEHLPDQVTVPKEIDEDQSIEVETEAEQEQEIEIEQEEQAEKNIHDLGNVNNNSWEDAKLCKTMNEFAIEVRNASTTYYHEIVSIKLSVFMKERENLKDVAEAFDDLYASANMFNWQSREIEEFELLGAYRKPFHFVRIQGSDVITVAACESQRWSRSNNLCNLTTGFLDDDAREVTDEERKKFVKLKFLDGQVTYTRKERELLKEWIRANDPVKMKKFFISQVLNGKPNKTARFQGSHLMKIFLELC
ncbi:MAG: hypothetical protein KDK48_04180, partial [Chlamydiia bacterium]|nr:hypothetical protein [Chlamydiia bacterium]